MNKVLSVLRTRAFWLGFNVCFFLNLALQFIQGKINWQTLLFFTFLTVMHIGVNKFFDNKVKN